MDVISGRNWRVLVGDVRDGLRTLPDNSVHCCVTSPPYWGLRDYGVDGQLGLEVSPEAFVAAMVEVFEEVRRVLRPDGTCWVNIGDSYNAYNGNAGPGSKLSKTQSDNRPKLESGHGQRTKGLKPKDLVGIPWRLAFGLQEAGWWLRSEIIWHKRTPMPESIVDRPTKAHEQIFMLTKAERYFFNQEAVREDCSPATFDRQKYGYKHLYGWVIEAAKGLEKRSREDAKASDPEYDCGQGRNIRTVQRHEVTEDDVRNWLEFLIAEAANESVWTLSAESFPGAHFATFPSKIPETAIKAGTSERGACAECGAPWARTVEKERQATRPGTKSKVNRASDDPNSPYERQAGTIVGNRDPQRHQTVTRPTGWEPTCECDSSLPTVPCVVLDPFSGSGTTGKVATELGRIYIGCELNPVYAEMSRTRIDSWKTRDAVKAIESLPGQKSLFG